MGAIQIYLPKEIMNELYEKIENKSQLIQNLLKEYFNKSKPLKEIKEDLIKEAEKKKQEVKQIEKEEEEIKKEKEEKEERSRIITEKFEKEKRERNFEKIRLNTLEVIKKYQVSEEESLNLLEEYLKIRDNVRLFEFMEKKGILKKEPFVPKR